MTSRISVGAAVAAVLLLVSPAASAEPPPVPPGFELTESTSPAEGLVHQTLVRSGPDPQVVHVARVRPDAGLAVRAVLSNERVAGPGERLERTSAMCRRVGCLVAVNADFAMPGEDTPVGGLVAAGELVRTFNDQHHQLSLRDDGSLTTDAVEWTGQVMPTDLRPVHLTGVNVARREGDMVLYTRHHGPSTGTNPHGVEMVLVPVQAGAPLKVGTTVAMRMAELRRAGDTPLDAGRYVVSGHGSSADALVDLGARIDAGAAGDTLLVRVETGGGVVQSVGGTPVLVRDGKSWIGAGGPSFVRGRHPRTIAGRTDDGTLLLVTVDGRQPGRSVGMSLAEAADLMLALGAVEALNLDGGGSTTFVESSQVANRPSDRLVRRDASSTVVHVPGAGEQVVGYVERPVVSALVVVPTSAATVVAAAPPMAEALSMPGVHSEAAPRTDPGSNPLDALPSLVSLEELVDGPPLGLAAAAALLLVLAAVGVGACSRGRLASARPPG